MANEKAKNSLESHIFETIDAMFSEEVVGVSTTEQRGVITTALTEAGDWLEEDGYIAGTKVGSHLVGKGGTLWAKWRRL